jgi:serine/threonine-protein kinase
MLKDKDFTAMLMDEARLAARIHHPNVLSTLDVVQTSDELVVVMEYVHGESLSKLSHTAADLGEPIPTSFAISIIIDALHGLHAAHEAKDESGHPLGLVHRDVSPQNLLVGVDGVTRIADFGIAKAAGRSHETRDGTVKGKLTYMAPEQIERGQLTRATDIFSISVVLWELLTGERLFDGSNDGEIIHRILSGNVRAPSEVWPSLPKVYDPILLRGLARDPALRYATARELALELEAVAPPVRPSEIGTWVERIASDTLVRRSRAISKIERSLPEPPAAAQTNATKPVTPPTGAIEGAGTNAKVTWESSNPGRSSSRMAIIAVVAAVCGIGAGVVWYTRDRAAPPATATAAPAVKALPTPPPAPTEAPAKDPTAAAAAPAAPVPSVTPAASTTPPKAGTARPRRSEAPALGKSPKPAAKNCDPPYSVDASGRHIFKLECM